MYNRGKDGQPRGFGFSGFSVKSSGSAAGGPSGGRGGARGGGGGNPVRKGTSVETHLAQIGFGMPGSLAPARGFGGAASNLGKRRIKSEEE